MRRRCASVLFVVAITSGLTGFTTGQAAADAPLQQGWWTVTNTGAVPVAVPPPDVPNNGLLVQGGPSGSNAYAALEYAVDDGQVATLTLHVARPSASVPGATLQLCPLRDTSFIAEQGGSIADAPAYGCGRTPVSAKPDASGTTYKFSVTSLISGDSLAVAILPTDATARVVLDAPGPASLIARPAAGHESPAPSPTTSPTASVAPSSDSGDASGRSGGGFTSGSGFDTGASKGGTVLADPTTEPRPVVASAPSATSAPATFDAASESGTSSGSAKPGAVALGVGALVFAMTLWTLAGNNESETGEPEAG